MLNLMIFVTKTSKAGNKKIIHYKYKSCQGKRQTFKYISSYLEFIYVIALTSQRNNISYSNIRYLCLRAFLKQ